MKKVSKYGIVLLSVAVLAATTSVATAVAADDVTGDNASAVETVTPAAEKQPLPFTLSYTIGGDLNQRIAPDDVIMLKPGEERTLIPKEIEGYKALSGPRYVDYEIIEGGLATGYDFIYEKVDQPDPKPDPKPTPQPSPNPTPDPTPQPDPTPTPQPKPEPEPQPDPKPAPQPGDDNKGEQAKPGDNGKGDGKAENPADNQKPADKDAAKQPEGEKPTDNSKASDQSKKSETVKPKTTEDKKEETKNKLPNTGEAVSSLGFLGVGLLSSLGLTKKRYKGRHERR